jgi:uncharacterized protein YecE (DUF72 family)
MLAPQAGGVAVPSIRVGTSGWSYAHWRGRFYPPGLPSSAWLSYYTTQFGTVELNGSFYRLPSPAAVAHWREVAPRGFDFAVKMSRFITHVRRLKEVHEQTLLFAERLSGLGPALGPFLVQLPPAFPADAARLNAFLDDLLAIHNAPVAVEFRDESWFVEDVLEVLRAHGAAFCISDLAGREWPHVVTAPLVYLRLHGPRRAYAGSYSDDALRRWARLCHAWQAEGRAVRVYFDNDEAAHAAADARRLLSFLGAGAPAPGTAPSAGD